MAFAVRHEYSRQIPTFTSNKEGDPVIKAAFFDIDGTLLSFETHTMPESTKRALDRMRESGIKTVISSGRPPYQLPPSIREGFDAYITLNGQLCYDSDGVFRSCPIAEDDVRAIVDQVRAGLYDVLVLQRSRAFANRLSQRIVTNAREVGLEYQQDDIACAFDEPVYQFCAYVEPGEEHLITDATHSVAHTRWTHLFCDVIPRSGGKNFGVKAVLERFGIAPEEAVAFGDGENDLAMFESVGTSVAMGNAWDSVKERATLVTSHVDDDGIYRACERLGII